MRMLPEVPEGVDDLIPYITAAGETPGVDAKGPMSWDGAEGSASLAKDIMAAANTSRGGIFVIGKAESGNQFELVGLTLDEAKSFDTTKVANWVNSRCGPPVVLTCNRVPYESKEFVVIVVREFADTPVICTKEYRLDGSKQPLLRRGSIYVRTANSESAPLRTADELRALIGLATTKRGDELLSILQALLRGQPLLPTQPTVSPYTEQRDEMLAMLDQKLDESAARGAWTFQFHPERFIEHRWASGELPPLVRKNAVRSRGRLYPGETRDSRSTNMGIMEHDYGRSAYALNRSGLFMYRYSYPENSRTYQSPWRPPDCLPPGSWLAFPLHLYVIVEFFWFLSRIAHELEPGERISYILLATGLSGRRLVTQSHDIDLPPTDPCVDDKFSRTRVVTTEAMRVDWETICLDTLCDFFRLLSGDTIRRETLADWVKKVQHPGA